MAAIIRIKRSTGAFAPGTLATGELAYSAGTGAWNDGGDRMFFGKGDDGNGFATTVEIIGGAYFANLLDHQPGVLTASSALIVDASSKIDVLNVDNITINGNTISSTDANGNIVLDPAGSGFINVSSTRIINLSDPVNPQDATTKAYVDAQNTAQILTINGDGSTTDTIDLDDSDLTFVGDDWLTSTVSNNTVTITHDVSGVTAGTYGSQTRIPIFTVDDRGHIDSAGSVPVATTLSTIGDAGTGSIDLLTQTITVAGGTNIHTVASGQTVIVHMDSDVLGLSSLTVDNLELNGNSITSTDTNGAINLTPNGTGEVVAATLTVSDLTNNRVVIAGASGALEDDTNFTFDGSTLTLTANQTVTGSVDITGDLDVDNVNINGNTIISTNSNGAINITPNGSGEVVISTATISDLTDNRVVIAGTAGALEDDGNFTFDGSTLTLVADQDITGILSVTGQANFDNVRIDGNIISTTDASNILVIDPSPVGDSAGGYGGTLIIRGNLNVQGTQTTINSTTVSINDKNLVLADSAADSAAADGAGITIGGANATITYNAGNDNWDFNKGINLADSDALTFNGIDWKEVTEDHLVSNFFLAGEAIDLTYDDGANTFTISTELATVSNVGAASFDSDQFTVTSGAVTIYDLDGGTY